MQMLLQIETLVVLLVMLGTCTLLVLVFGRLDDPIDDEVAHRIQQSADLVAICSQAVDEQLVLDSAFGEFSGVRWQIPVPPAAPPVAAMRR